MAYTGPEQRYYVLNFKLVFKSTRLDLGTTLKLNADCRKSSFTIKQPSPSQTAKPFIRLGDLLIYLQTSISKDVQTSRIG